MTVEGPGSQEAFAGRRHMLYSCAVHPAFMWKIPSSPAGRTELKSECGSIGTGTQVSPGDKGIALGDRVIGQVAAAFPGIV